MSNLYQLKDVEQPGQYDSGEEVGEVSRGVTALVFGPLLHKKVKARTFQEHTKMTYHLAVCNSLVASLDLLKKAQKAEWDLDEIIGALQMDVYTNWRRLSQDKIGGQAFKPLILEDIIESEDPVEYLKCGLKNKMRNTTGGPSPRSRVVPSIGDTQYDE